MAKKETEVDVESAVASLVRRNETDYISGQTTISKYVNFSLSDNITKIDAYLNSKHTSGDTDSMGREKPFFNIVTAAVNIWFRATDIDRKNIKIRATKASDTLAAMLATIHLQNWMKKTNFGIFLNEWGRTLSRYGSAVVKFIENAGELHSIVVPWNRLIVDQIDFDNDVVIEVLELTPAQLRKREGYDQEMVDNLIDSLTTRKTLEQQQKDTKANFIKVYEVHGELPLSYLTGKEKDEDTFVQQMHVVSFVAKKGGKYDDFTLYKGKEEKNPYMITHLIKEDGRTQSIGAVEHLFEPQWMINHTSKAIKDQLDLASKLIFQTSDPNFVGQNALNAIETGDILIHKVNEPLTSVANSSHDISSLQSYGNQWKSIGNEINGISESMMGATAPSGTAWRQVQTLLQESHSLFELMTENKGLHLEDMFRVYVIPYLKKKMNNSKEIAATLDDYGVQKIENMYVKSEAIRRHNNVVKKEMLAQGTSQGIDIQAEQQKIKGELTQNGSQRFFVPSEQPDVTWKELFKDLEWDLEVDITGENAANNEDLATLNTVLQTIATNPKVLNDPNAKLVFNKILAIAGNVSPLELAEIPPAEPAPPSQKVSESMSYKDVPEDVKRQIEQQAGLQPSQGGALSAPANPSVGMVGAGKQ